MRTSIFPGFTLIETLIVIGIIGIFITFSLSVDVGTYMQSFSQSNESLVRAGLRHARSEAMNGVCLGTCTGQDHGIYLSYRGSAATLTIFQGYSYATRDSAEDETISLHSEGSANDSSEIIFTAFSGITIPTIIKFSKHSLYVSSEGAIRAS